MPLTQLSKALPGSLEPFLFLLRESGLGSPKSRPESLTNDQEQGSAGDCFCLGLGGTCVRVSRALAPRSPSQSGATRAPRSVPRSSWAGPAPSRSQHFATERSLLPSLSTSSTIRGVAPPLARVHPRNLGSLCSPFPSVSCRLAAQGLALYRAARVSSASLLRLRAVSLGSHRVPHPQLFACDPKSGSRALTPPPHPPADSRARGPASHSRRPRSTRPPPPPSLIGSRSPGALALALSKASALPARALRALVSPGSCQCGDCAGKHGDRGNDPY